MKDYRPKHCKLRQFNELDERPLVTVKFLPTAEVAEVARSTERRTHFDQAGRQHGAAAAGKLGAVVDGCNEDGQSVSLIFHLCK